MDYTKKYTVRPRAQKQTISYLSQREIKKTHRKNNEKVPEIYCLVTETRIGVNL